MEEKDVWLIRVIKRFYEPWLDRVLAHPVLTAGTGLTAIAICVPIALGLGAEFGHHASAIAVGDDDFKGMRLAIESLAAFDVRWIEA